MGFDMRELVTVNYGPNGGQIAEIVDVREDPKWKKVYKLSFAPGVFVAEGSEWQPEFMIRKSHEIGKR